jgi:hypothetical protein
MPIEAYVDAIESAYREFGLGDVPIKGIPFFSEQ